MATDVEVAGTTVNISGEPGSLSITEETFIGPEGITVDNQTDAVNVLNAVAVEVAKAWPNVKVTVTTTTT